MGGTLKGARHGLAGRRARVAWYVAGGLAVAFGLLIVFQFRVAAHVPALAAASGNSARAEPLPGEFASEARATRGAQARDRDLPRALLGALVASARETARNPPPKPAPSHVSRPTVGPLARATAQDALRAAAPLLRECYETLLREQPDAGSFELQVAATIDADPALGGVVSSAELSGGELESRPEFARCLRETLLSIEFEADTNAGQANVRFPLRFAPTASPSSQRGEPPPR